jgi:hypothetical protein
MAQQLRRNQRQRWGQAAVPEPAAITLALMGFIIGKSSINPLCQRPTCIRLAPAS